MSAESSALSTEGSKAWRAILWGGLIAGIMDIAAAFINSRLRSGRSPLWVLQAIASGVLGADSYKGGFATAALGAAFHFLIAVVACAVYYAASRKISFLTQHFVLCGLLYGVVVYAFMNMVVLPLTFQTKFSPSLAVLITGLLIHMFCVGLPISVSVRHFSK